MYVSDAVRWWLGRGRIQIMEGKGRGGGNSVVSKGEETWALVGCPI